MPHAPEQHGPEQPGPEQHRLDRRRLDQRRLDRRCLIRRVVCLGAAVLSVLCLVCVIVAGSVSASAAPTSVELCDQQVSPGHATCFAVRNTGMAPMVAGTPAGYGPADLQ